MKGIAILIAGLALLAASEAAVVKTPASRVSLNVGNPQYADILLYAQNVIQQPISNAVQYQDVTYRGTTNTRISAVRALEIGYTQYASPQIIAGGIGYNYVTTRITSARGYGYNFAISVWGS